MNQLDKPTPANHESEKQVIGCLLTRKTAIDEAVRSLPENAFDRQDHRLIWKGCLSLYNGLENISVPALQRVMAADGTLDAAGGMVALYNFASRSYSMSEMLQNMKMLRELAVRRTLINSFGTLWRKAYDPTCEVEGSIAEAVAALTEGLNSLSESDGAVSAEKAVHDTLEAIEKARNSNESGLKFGLTEFDNKLAGLKPGDLCILAARPGMGKTAKALQMSKHVSKNYGDVLLFSLEMIIPQLWGRLISSETGISGHKFRDPKTITDEEYERILSLPDKGLPPIWTDDKLVHLDAICALARVVKRSVPDLKMIVIDYLQLMKIKSFRGNREQEISTISRTLKQLAKELLVPVVALSQLSRAVEQRGGDKKPMLSDLRESGAIEQDADQVIFIWRPDYYDITEDHEGNSIKDLSVSIIAKNRHGSVGEAKMRWDGSTTSFSNWKEANFESFKPANNAFAPDSNAHIQSRVNTDDEEIMF